MATMFPPCSHKVHCLRIIVCSMILSSLRNATLFCFFPSGAHYLFIMFHSSLRITLMLHWPRARRAALQL